MIVNTSVLNKDFFNQQFKPDEKDGIYAYSKTTGVVDYKTVVHGVTFDIYDTGGQRSERKKWSNSKILKLRFRIQDVKLYLLCYLIKSF